MSSNIIKAYSIAYDKEKIQLLDMEDREEKLMEKIKTLMPLPQFDSEETDGFVQGIPVQTLDPGMISAQEEVAAAEAPAMSEADIEALKNTLREEIMKEMDPILQRKGEDIVSNARAQAEGIIESAKKEAEAEREKILKDASQKGYEEGTKKAKEEENQVMVEYELKKKQLEKEYEDKIAKLEPAFVGLLSTLVKKVTGIAYNHHKEILLYLLQTGLEFAQKDTYFDVYLNEKDYTKFSSLFPKIQAYYKGKMELEFKKGTGLAEGSCRLENENRVIDCGIGIRLNGLLEELDLLGS